MTFPHSLAPTLPYDVVLSVIEILLAESRDSPECIDVLQTFSLVSQSFVPFCQKKLFRRFNMGKTDEKKCFSILQQSPHLIPYVEEVWMYLGGQGVVNVTVAEMEVLRVLTSLCHLSVVAQTTPETRYVYWKWLSLSVRRTITSLLLPRRITSFAIVGVEALPDGLLTTWRHLKSLSVWNENPHPSLYRDSDSDDTDDEDPHTTFGDDSSYFSSRATIEDSVAIPLETLSLIDSDNILLFMLVEPDMIDDESPFIAPSNGSPDPDRARGLAISQTYRSFQTDYNLQPPSHFDFSQLCGFTIDIIESNLLPVFSVIHHARNTLVTLDIRQRYLYNIHKDPFGFDSSTFLLILFHPHFSVNYSLLDTTGLLAHSPDSLPDEVSLESLIHLQHLSITLLILEHMPVHLNTLSSWCSLLRTAPRDIRTLEITLDAFYFNSVLDLLRWFPDLDDDDDAANTPLSTLDEIISNPDSFPCLEFVRVRVRLPEDDRIGGSESDMTVDVVDEQDLPRLQTWFDKYWKEDDSNGRRTPSSSGDSMTVDVVTDEDLALYAAMGDDFEPDHSDSSRTASSYIGTEPSFNDESAEDRSHPIPFERVEESISQMLRLTAKRFCNTNSFVVEVDFGAHVGKVLDWGYPKRRRVGLMDNILTYRQV